MFIQNTGFVPVPAPLFMVLDNLRANAALLNADGTTAERAPAGSPHVSVPVGDGDNDNDEFLLPFETRRVLLEFSDPSSGNIDFSNRVLDVTPAP